MSQSAGLMVSVKRLAGTLLAILHTRLELLSNELEEERLRVRQMVLFGSIALFLFGMATMLMTVFVVVLFWDSYRLQVLAGLTMLFLVAGLLVLNSLRSMAQGRSKLFSTSLSELSDDMDRLTPPP